MDFQGPSDFQGQIEFPTVNKMEANEGVSGKIGEEIGGDIFIPMESDPNDGCTLDEPVATTLVSSMLIYHHGCLPPELGYCTVLSCGV